MKNQFHVSLPCFNVKETQDFYCNIIGSSIGRNTEEWVDINLFNHQITFIESGKFKFKSKKYSFENTILPSFHLGIIMGLAEWQGVYEKLKSIVFIDYTTFLKGKNGEHRAFYLKDPNGYVIEFKCFKDDDTIFKK